MGTILSRLKGRKVEIQEYMKKIEHPQKISDKLNAVFIQLKTITLNQKLIQLADTISDSVQSKDQNEEENKDFELTNYVPQYENLFCFVNSEQVEDLKQSALKHHKDLEVSIYPAQSDIDKNCGNDQES